MCVCVLVCSACVCVSERELKWMDHIFANISITACDRIFIPFFVPFKCSNHETISLTSMLSPTDPVTPTAPAMKSYMYYDDDVWVDEAKAVFAANKKDNPEAKLRPLLLEMFGAHQDVFSLILTFLRRSGKIRQPKLSLPRIVVIEFQKWLRENKSSGEDSK